MLGQPIIKSPATARTLGEEMIAGNNKERLQQEIAKLIEFISEGRELFFDLTGNNLNSSDEMINHWTVMDLFQTHNGLIQLDLNIQLLYIKLSSYYSIESKDDFKSKGIRLPRNVFAHDWNNLVFNGKVKYNFLIYKVSQNFKKVMYMFYQEDGDEEGKTVAKSETLDIHEDIKRFLEVWGKTSTHEKG